MWPLSRREFPIWVFSVLPVAPAALWPSATTLVAAGFSAPVTAPQPRTSRPAIAITQRLSRPDATTIITGIILTGTDAKVGVAAPDLDSLIGPGAVNEFRADENTPNVFIGLGNGLTVFPSELVFTCTGLNGGAGEGNYTLLGQ